MWAALLAKYGLPALALGKQYWREAGCVVAILFVFLYFRVSGQLAACRHALEHQTTPTLAQIQTVDSKGNAQVRVIYRPVPCPSVSVDGKTCPPCICPELDVQAQADYTAAIMQAQSMTTTAACPSLASNSLFIGGGYFGKPLAQVDVVLGNWKANAMIGDGIYGGGISRKLCEW